MRRNLGSEILIAIGAVAIIICGLFFALLLSNPSNPPSPTNISSSLVTSVAQSNTDDVGEATPELTEEATLTNTAEPTPTDTSVPTATNTEVPSETPLPTLTETEMPSDTPEPKATVTEIPTDTPLPIATDTDIPSDTPTATATDTDIPSDTPTATATDTEIPSETPTATATETETPLPSATDTDIPSDTPTATATETDAPSDTPTATVTETETPLPSATDTDVPSDTPTATETETPSDTPTATLTLTPSNTPSPTATSTSVNAFTGIIPTPPPSPTVVPLDEPTRTPASCDLPRGWTIYTVLSGDTLFAISLVTNSTVDELRFANCIDDIDNIIAGQDIFVPIEPLEPVSTLVPSGIRQGLSAIGCISPMTQITSPIIAQRVSGTFTVFGTATSSEFQYYKIEIRPDFASIYNFYSDSQTQVSNGALGLINAGLFGEGLHWIRLTVVDIRGGIQPEAICEIPVIFE